MSDPVKPLRSSRTGSSSGNESLTANCAADFIFFELPVRSDGFLGFKLFGEYWYQCWCWFGYHYSQGDEPENSQSWAVD
jgi:hypothetical protein